MSKPERIRINHKGGGIARAAIALESIFDAFFRWAAQEEKFHVSIDYDPEWTLLVRFRSSTKEEAEELDSLRPTEEETNIIKGQRLDS